MENNNNYQNQSNFYENSYENQDENPMNNEDNGVDNEDDTNNDNINNGNSQEGDDNITEPEQFRKVFIGGLSYKTDDETLQNYFAKYGKLVDYVVMKDGQSGRSRGFGFVTYSHSYMVDELMKNRPHIIDGRQVEPKRATPREDSGRAEVQMTVKKLFIGGLRENINEDDLRSYFNQYGGVLEVVIMKEKDSSKSRGFGFVTFDDYDPIDKIILEKHHTINGVNVHVQKALPKDFEKPQYKSQGAGNKNYNSNQHNKTDYYMQNTSSNNNNNGNHNPSMPSNFNNFAQMAASFFAAAANKMNPNGSNSSANPTSRSMYNNNNYGGYGGNYPNSNAGPNSNANMNYPMSNGSNNSNLSNKVGMPFGSNSPNAMGTIMNQLMNPNGPMAGMMANMPNNASKMMSNQSNNLGPMRAGQGKFFNRSGAPYATGGNTSGRGRGGNRGGRGGRNQ